ncbi:transcriptional regulator-domain-containing protein [Halteromyces radiatus]|uniref:transcriptional regulator-domain-containing protein n=1 Tax=Halteromyces radiatus TaxID=101107 RepID=UPI002220FAE5|nr:transcriptional regulator-domain-containing protein [Halteromyces radiatus]KAI8089556.1 transcriptional regulator-domain-containing protein [Halteromyces radiatus]
MVRPLILLRSTSLIRSTQRLSPVFNITPVQSSIASLGCLYQQQRFAGHNKWSKVKHTKGAKDAKKSKLFSKIGLEITRAVRAGGSDPNINTRLSTILNRAKANNMTKDSIENAMKKASDKNRDAMEDVLYECYGPGGIAMIIEAVTDKKSRAVKEVKEVLNRHGGSVSSVGWLFEKKGKIAFATGESGHTLDQMMDAAIDAGAEDIEEEEDLVEITCDFTELNNISKTLSNQQYEVREMEATYIPQSSMEITDPEMIETVAKCLESMENLDDVVKIHCNAVLPDDAVEEVDQ